MSQVRNSPGKPGYVDIFCYSCKQYVTVPKKTATREFKDAGHSDRRVAFMEPDVGRSTRRHEQAVEALRRKQESLQEVK